MAQSISTPLDELVFHRGIAMTSADPAANYVILATIDPAGFPCMRTLTVRELGSAGIKFHVNSRSPKIEHIDENGRAELLFLWATTLVQVRVRGRITVEQDEAVTRAWAAKATSSQAADVMHAELLPQSRVITGREELLRHYAEAVSSVERRNPAVPSTVVTLSMAPQFIEIWTASRSDRMHDRRRHSLRGEKWVTETLVP
jgi:pyridoxamine 5'-phosphate oxidase